MPGKTSKPPAKTASKPAAKKAAKKASKKVAKKTAATTPKPRKTAAKPQPANTATPRLLSGGNPQIAKAYGDAPVQAYIAAMPGWKSAIGRQIDTLVERAVPEVYKAVKWNSPLYGIEGEGWFLSMHTFNHYVKVAFFRGASLDPVPPGESRTPHTRYLNVREDEPIDEAQFIAWVKQARRLPGEKM
ncbi:DUF1801 domain-containing protein [Lysobacter sp. Root690]|uniref:DUF1801 domain-containing protein n=1 Tax=Lysobacter sp. Root690 TaxID=1736588 RepID=UPI0009ECC310|nr:DUF1801 domain-containing protein [Lysobacter sp. Root690]